MQTISLTIKQEESLQFVLQVLKAMRDKGMIELKDSLNILGENEFVKEGKPMTTAELLQQIDEAEEAFQCGEGLTTAQLRQRLKEWM